jgi:hypothetical protein
VLEIETGVRQQTTTKTLEYKRRIKTTILAYPKTKQKSSIQRKRNTKKQTNKQKNQNQIYTK